jgi:transcriptional regulator with GAF, ATPase, and Fis domain
VPILLKGKPIGVLGVNNKARHDEFTDRHTDLLLNLASLAAIAIENARIHQETVQRARELQSLVEAAEVVSASVAMFETLPTICEQLVRVVNVGWSAIFDWDREAGCLVMLAQYRQNFWRMGQGPKITSNSIVKNLNNHDIIVTGGTDKDLDLAHSAVHTIVTIPVRSEQQVLGAVRAYYIEAPTTEINGDLARRINHIGLEG